MFAVPIDVPSAQTAAAKETANRPHQMMRRKGTPMKKVLGIGALAALLFAGAGVFNARATDTDSRVYRPTEGWSYNFGSKLAVGYFQQKDGACALDIFLAENTWEGAGPAAARLRAKVAPQESVKLNAAEGQALEIKCGDAAATLEVRGGSVQARYVQR
jgi:hypothetical protein